LAGVAGLLADDLGISIDDAKKLILKGGGTIVEKAGERAKYLDEMAKAASTTAKVATETAEVVAGKSIVKSIIKKLPLLSVFL
jgi:hypothetical protein